MDHQPRLHVAVNKRSFARRLNCKITAIWLQELEEDDATCNPSTFIRLSQRETKATNVKATQDAHAKAKQHSHLPYGKIHARSTVNAILRSPRTLVFVTFWLNAMHSGKKVVKSRIPFTISHILFQIILLLVRCAYSAEIII